MRNLRIHSHLSSQTSFLFYFDDELNNSSSNLSSIFDIEAILLIRKSFDILSIYLTNQLDFFDIDDEFDNISNSDLKSILQISHTFDQYFDKNSILKSFVFFENIAKSYLFY